MKKSLFAQMGLAAFIAFTSQAFSQSPTASARIDRGDEPAGRGTSTVTVQAIQKDMAEAITAIENNYVGGRSIDYDEVFKTSIDSMLHTLDPHSSYYDAKETEQFRTQQRSEYYGIGATIGDMSGPDGKVIATYIKATFDGAPAHRAGLRYGDKIVEVDGQSMLGKPFFEVRNFLRGKAGTVARVVVERAATGRRETVEITRGAVPQPSVGEAYMIRPGIGYVAMRGEFTRVTSNEFKAAMAKLRAAGMKEVILDLRDNGGGLVFQASDVANHFLSTGQTIFSQTGRFRNLSNVFQAENPLPNREPVVVLVNRNTASASEILAGALQDHDRALIVGQNTFGKGLIQFPFDDIAGSGSMLLLTIAKYQTPSGRQIQRDYSNSGLYEYTERGGSLPVESTTQKGEASKTDMGREVFGGGGIAPDVVLKPQTITIERDREQRRLANPVFAFALDLVTGRVKGFESYKVPGAITFGHDLVATDFPVTPALYQAFKQFAVEKYKVAPAEVEAEREFIDRMLRSELVTAAFGSQTSYQVFNQYDEQLQKAIDLLPQAKQLALQAEQTRNRAGRNPAN